MSLLNSPEFREAERRREDRRKRELLEFRQRLIGACIADIERASDDSNVFRLKLIKDGREQELSVASGCYDGESWLCYELTPREFNASWDW